MTQQASSRSVILRESEFADRLRLSSVCQGFLARLRSCLHDPDSQRLHSAVTGLAGAAHALESFLDDHGARQNRRFATFGELTASARGLASVKATVLHIRHRLSIYGLMIGVEPLLEALTRVEDVLDGFIRNLASRLIDEAAKLDLQQPGADEQQPASEDVSPRQLLPRDLDAAEASDERQHLAEIAARFLTVLDASRNLNLSEARAPQDLVKFVSVHATEERCRWYESAVHNIQSMYDTWVQGTALEQQEPWLTEFRGRVSVALHLLEMATSLIHFYERHESEDRHERAREAIAAVVPPEAVLDISVNICLRQAYLYVESCSHLAHKIIDSFVSEDIVTLALPDGVVLHARPLALIVKVARRHGTPVEIIMDGDSCSASSLMSLIMLGGKHPQPAAIEARGEARALQDLSLLFKSGLGETGPLPDELEYLTQ